MPRMHPRARVLAVLARSPVPMPSDSIAAESGIEPKEAVGHLRILRARSLVVRLRPSAVKHGAEWVAVKE